MVIFKIRGVIKIMAATMEDLIIDQGIMVVTMADFLGIQPCLLEILVIVEVLVQKEDLVGRIGMATLVLSLL